MKLLDFNQFRSKNQIEFVAYVDKNNFNNIEDKEFENGEKIVFRFFELNETTSKLLRKDGIKKYYFLGESYYYYDYLPYKQFILKNLLSWWNLDVELERNEFGVLSDECLESVCKIHPSILNHFIGLYEEDNEIPNSDTQKIIDQCHNLFRRGSKGIRDADESISTYCNLTGFWEKLGLNYFDIQRLPEDLFNKLSLIMRKDNEIQAKELEKMSKPSGGKGGGNIIGQYNF